jgi:hypothetical protein
MTDDKKQMSDEWSEDYVRKLCVVAAEAIYSVTHDSYSAEYPGIKAMVRAVLAEIGKSREAAAPREQSNATKAQAREHVNNLVEVISTNQPDFDEALDDYAAACVAAALAPREQSPEFEAAEVALHICVDSLQRAKPELYLHRRRCKPIADELDRRAAEIARLTAIVEMASAAPTKEPTT